MVLYLIGDQVCVVSVFDVVEVVLGFENFGNYYMSLWCDLVGVLVLVVEVG